MYESILNNGEVSVEVVRGSVHGDVLTFELNHAPVGNFGYSTQLPDYGFKRHSNGYCDELSGFTFSKAVLDLALAEACKFIHENCGHPKRIPLITTTSLLREYRQRGYYARQMDDYLPITVEELVIRAAKTTDA